MSDPDDRDDRSGRGDPGDRDERDTRSRRRRPEPPRLYEHELPGGWIVLAGRTDSDNDRLSLKIARPGDWWFHVRGVPGSHVVLQVPAGREPDRAILTQAAAIAAWYSKRRNARRVTVSYTRGRYVTKPRGAEPGSVMIRKEKVIQVKPGLPDR